MNPRPAYIKLRDEVKSSGMTWAQLKSKDWQFDIDALLTVDEKKALKRYSFLVMKWLKADWRKDQLDDLLQNKILPAFRAISDDTIITPSLNAVYDYMISKGVSQVTAKAYLEIGATTYFEEARNG